MDTLKLTVKEVQLLLEEVYRSPSGGMGCCCHIVIEDHNVSNRDVEFCLQSAVERQHPKCIRLAAALAQLSRTQRTKLRSISHEI